MKWPWSSREAIWVSSLAWRAGVCSVALGAAVRRADNKTMDAAAAGHVVYGKTGCSRASTTVVHTATKPCPAAYGRV